MLAEALFSSVASVGFDGMRWAFGEAWRLIRSLTATSFKDVMQGIQALVTTVAIGVGGWWSYRLFVRKRERYPRAKVTHLASHWPLGEERILLRVAVDISNQGAVLLIPGAGELWVQQVRPLLPELAACLGRGEDPVAKGGTEVEWPLLAKRPLANIREIEPGENDQCHCDFFLGAEVQTVVIYSHIENRAKRRRLHRWRKGKPLVWNTTTSYDFPTATVGLQPPPEASDLPTAARPSGFLAAARQLVVFPHQGSGRDGPGTKRR